MIQQKEDNRTQQLDRERTLIDSLLRSENFAVTIAQSQSDAYYVGVGETPPPFLLPDDDTTSVNITQKDEKIAINLAGFYALECGLDYLVTTQHKLPSDILKSITDGTISQDDKQLLCRFANATWKAGQPFRGLDRITRRTFTSFYFLTQDDVEKDWVQVKAAAKLMLEKL